MMEKLWCDGGGGLLGMFGFGVCFGCLFRSGGCCCCLAVSSEKTQQRLDSGIVDVVCVRWFRSYGDVKLNETGREVGRRTGPPVRECVALVSIYLCN